MKIKLPSMSSFGRGAPPPPSPSASLSGGLLAQQEPGGGGDRMRLLARRMRGVAGYALLFVAVFFVFVWVCLPTRAIAWRIGQAAREAGYNVDIEDLSVSPFTGVTLYNVRWTFQPSHAGQIPRKLELEEVEVDISLLGLMFGKYDVELDTWIGDATIHAAYARSASESSIKIKVSELPLSEVPKLQQSVNAPLFGLFALDVDLTMPENLFARAEGTIRIECSACTIGDGVTLLYVPGATGIMAKGITLPMIDLGSLGGSLVVTEGKATADSIETTSDDISLKISGGMNLADPFAKTAFAFDLKLLITPALQDRSEPLKLMVQTAGPTTTLDPPEQDWLGFKLRGTGGRPKFMGINTKSREESERERRQKALESAAQRKAKKAKREREAKNTPPPPPPTTTQEEVPEVPDLPTIEVAPEPSTVPSTAFGRAVEDAAGRGEVDDPSREPTRVEEEAVPPDDSRPVGIEEERAAELPPEGVDDQEGRGQGGEAGGDGAAMEGVIVVE